MNLLRGSQEIGVKRLVNDHSAPKEENGCVAAWSVCETWILRGSFTGARQAVALF